MIYSSQKCCLQAVVTVCIICYNNCSYYGGQIMKIAITGYSGSGKSTTAQKLGEKYNIPVLHLDMVQFAENWHERDKEESKRMVAQFMLDNGSWVIDGNYKDLLQAERFDRADMIVFFSFNRFACFFRALGRYIKYKGRTRPDMAPGCNEKFDFEFMKWILLDGRTLQKKKAYRNMCKKHSNKVVILKNQKQLDSFLKNL